MGRRNSYTLSSGFTLMEMIVALGIFATFAAVGIAAVNPFEQFKKAQDARRKSDLAQIARALEVYYNDFGEYPSHTTGNPEYQIDAVGGAVAWGNQWDPYIDILPEDPSSSRRYIYWSNGQTYRLYASLLRADKDPDACMGGAECSNAIILGQNLCGGPCNYGVTSPNTSP